MRAQIQIPDDLYDLFSSQAEALAASGKSVTPEEIMADRLGRFKDVEPGDRVVVVDSKTRGRLEALLGGGSLFDAPDLLAKVQKLSNVQIGEIKLDFTTAETAKLHRWSRGSGIPLVTLLNDTVTQLKMHILESARD